MPAPDSKQSAPHGSWKRIPDAEIEQWNDLLLRSNAHLHQFPYWNEALRGWMINPEYFVYMAGQAACAYACIVSIGIYSFRFGLLRGGPVNLCNDQPVSIEIAGSLLQMAAASGYVFVRISLPGEWLLSELAGSFDSERVDPFPAYGHTGFELLIPQQEGDRETLAQFTKTVRQEIRKAAQDSCAIGFVTEAAAIPRTWGLVRAMEKKKGRRVYKRSAHSFARLLEGAARHGAGRLYTASIDGRMVQTILIVRDRDCAHFIMGASDTSSFGTHPSPSCLLHWTAMREFYRLGTARYNLGSGGWGGLMIFKNKFRPEKLVYAPPLTVILRPRAYRWLRPLLRGQWRALLSSKSR